MKRRLDGLGLDAHDKEKVLTKAISDVGYVNRIHGRLRKAVVGAYVEGLWYSHGKFLMHPCVQVPGKEMANSW